MFCPKCSSILLPKTDRGKRILACSCGFKSNELDSLKLKESIAKPAAVEVIDESIEENSLPRTDADCPKCPNLRARFWTQQTRAADEPPTRFFKCTKCDHVWREYN